MPIFFGGYGVSVKIIMMEVKFNGKKYIKKN